VLSVGGAPCKSRTRFSALQERRIAGNACGAEKLGASGANRTPEATFKDWRLSTNRTPFFTMG